MTKYTCCLYCTCRSLLGAATMFAVQQIVSSKTATSKVQSHCLRLHNNSYLETTWHAHTSLDLQSKQNCAVFKHNTWGFHYAIVKAIETKDHALLMQFVGNLTCTKADWNINYSHHGLFWIGMQYAAGGCDCACAHCNVIFTNPLDALQEAREFVSKEMRAPFNFQVTNFHAECLTKCQWHNLSHIFTHYVNKHGKKTFILISSHLL